MASSTSPTPRPISYTLEQLLIRPPSKYFTTKHVRVYRFPLIPVRYLENQSTAFHFILGGDCDLLINNPNVITSNTEFWVDQLVLAAGDEIKAYFDGLGKDT